MKKVVLLLIIVMLVLPIGCTSYREIERGYIVTAIGIGKDTNGINIIAEVISSSATGNNISERMTLSATGKTIPQAYDSLKLQLTKPLYFDHLGTLIVEEYLNSNVKIQAIDFCGRLQSVSLGLYVVTTPDLQSLFNVQTPDSILGYDIIGLVKNYANQTNTVINNQLYMLQRFAKEQVETQLPTISVVKSNLSLNLPGVSK